MRALFALLLALSLTLGSVAEAVARNQMEGASGQLICGSDGARLVSLDASGTPVSPHSCSHCLAAAIAGILTTAPLTKAPAAIQPADLPLLVTLQPGIAPLAKPHARGPPPELV